MLQCEFTFPCRDGGKDLSVVGYFHDWYYGMSSPNNRIRFVNTLKNDRQTSTHEEDAIRTVLAASYAQRDSGKDSGSRFAMGKAAEYGVSRYVVYDADRDSGDPMFNLSRDEIASGASVIKPEDAASSSVLKTRNTTRQLGLGL